MTPPLVPLRERRVFVDTSAYLAILDEDDEHHAEAAALLRHLAAQRYRQFTTNILLIESHALLLAAMGRLPAARFLKDAEDIAPSGSPQSAGAPDRQLVLGAAGSDAPSLTADTGSR